MIAETQTLQNPKSHPPGGFFVSLRRAVLCALLPLSACVSPTTEPAVQAGPTPEVERIPNPLGAYRQLGYIVGNRGFAAVGRFAYLPGPADSVFVVFGLSLPNAALRFRRDPPGFLAHYHVSVTLTDSLGSGTSLDKIEEVRVLTFRETSRRDESIVFQAILKLVPGVYQARIDARDVGSSAGFTAEAEVTVPEFGSLSITAPIIVYQVEPRTSRELPPTLIMSPRATVEIGVSEESVFVESYLDESAPTYVAVLEALDQNAVLWTDTLAFTPTEGALRTALAPLAYDRLPPGGLTLRARLSGTSVAATGPLLVALLPDWLFVDFEDAMNYLRYSGTAGQLDSLRNAPPGERAQRLQAFWSQKDSVPETAENEFFMGYFRRIREANDRFSEESLPGWLTARGEVYVTLGPPDEVFRQLETEGQPRTQAWVYNKSLGFELRLVFFDETGLGAFRLTPHSRQAFREAVQRLYS